MGFIKVNYQYRGFEPQKIELNTDFIKWLTETENSTIITLIDGDRIFVETPIDQLKELIKQS